MGNSSGDENWTFSKRRTFSRFAAIPVNLCCHVANPSDRCDLSRSTFGHLVARTRPSIAVANLLHD